MISWVLGGREYLQSACGVDGGNKQPGGRLMMYEEAGQSVGRGRQRHYVPGPVAAIFLWDITSPVKAFAPGNPRVLGLKSRQVILQSENGMEKLWAIARLRTLAATHSDNQNLPIVLTRPESWKAMPLVMGSTVSVIEQKRYFMLPEEGVTCPGIRPRLVTADWHHQHQRLSCDVPCTVPICCRLASTPYNTFAKGDQCRLCASRLVCKAGWSASIPTAKRAKHGVAPYDKHFPSSGSSARFEAYWQQAELTAGFAIVVLRSPPAVHPS